MKKTGILQKIAGKEWWERKRRIESLLERPEAEYLPELEEGVRNHEDANIRNTAMEIFRLLGTRGLPSIVALSRDPDHEVRLFAVNIMHQTGLREVQPELLRALGDEDVNVRVAAAEALGKIGDDAAVTALQRLFSDEPWVAMAGVAAIGEIGGDKAAEVLIGCLGSESLEEIAVDTLRRFGTVSSIGFLVSHARSAINRELTIRAIVSIAERERIRPNAELFRELLPDILAMLEKSGDTIDRDAFIALCWANDVAGLPYMIRAMSSDDLQEYAIEGLLDLGNRSVPAIVDAIGKTVGAPRVMLAKVLSMLGAYRELLGFSGDDSAGVRTEVALGAAELDGEVSIRTLRALLDDPAEEVRMAARRSLDTLGLAC